MRINKLAIPLMLNSISSTVINLCDQAMVGRTYLEGFASVGIIGSNIYSITGVLGALSIGFNIIGAKAKGRNDYENLNNSFYFSILTSITIGVLFLWLCLFYGELILEKYFNIHGNTLNDATMYLKIFSLSLGVNLILFNISSYFKIINEAKYILYGNLISCILNICFDYVLIFGKLGFPKLGIVGNAIGSVLSLICCLLFYIIIINKHRFITITKIDIFNNAKEILSVSAPLISQEFVESTIIVFMMNYILSQIGLLEVSIYNLLFSIVNVALMPMYAYSQACLNIISEDLGANNTINIINTIKSCMIRALLLYVSIGTIILLFKNYIPMITTNDVDLIFYSSRYMFVIILANIINIPSCILKFSLQALGDEKIVFMYSTLASFISTALIYILVYKLNGNLNSVYLGVSINYIILSISLYYRLYSTRKNKFFII